MIPTLILFGLLFGRWWRTTLLVSAVGWPVLLVGTGVTSIEPQLAAVALLAVVNAGVGVLIHQAALRGVRGLRRERAPRAESLP